jgi:hypothetical protein
LMEKGSIEYVAVGLQDSVLVHVASLTGG